MNREDQIIEMVVRQVVRELKDATKKFGPFKNAHHGYAVILEELDELWDEIKDHKVEGSLGRQRGEAIQVAAMTLRFLIDVIYNNLDYEDDLP